MVAFADVEALLATQDATEVVQEAARSSFALSGFTRDTMTKGRTRTPLVSILPTAGWESGELGSTTRRKNVSNWGVSPKYLVAVPMSTIVPLPEEVIDDSSYDVWGAIKPGISTIFARMLDAAVLFGVNKPAQWTDAAVIPGAIAAGNVVYAGDATDIAAAINGAFELVEEDGYDVTGVASKRSIRSALRGLRDANGAPIFVSELASAPGSVATVYGAPLYSVNNGAWDSTVAQALVGNLSYVHIGVRQDMTFKVLDQATLESGSTTIHLGQEDALALRVTFRVAYAIFDPVNPEAVDGYPFAVVAPGSAPETNG